MYDYSGREILQKKFSSESLSQGEMLNLQGYGNGIYTIRYLCGEVQKVLKLIIARN